MYSYSEIAKAGLEILEALPLDVPSEGYLAGFDRIPFDGHLAEIFQQGDNYHYPLGETYLTFGFRGVADLARRTGAQADGEKQEMFAGIAATYDAVADYCKRYAEAVAGRIGNAGDPEDAARLSVIQNNLEVLSQAAPRTFLQAVQSVYLMWRIRSLRATSCIGRLDCKLKPFYETDIARRILTEEQALSYICEFWERINALSSGDTLVNVMVGGRNPDGSDASCRLSALMLEATRRIRKTEPHINVRYHKGIRPDVLDAAYRVQCMGHGQASFYNDEVVIPALIRAGIPEKWACRYANDGCTEILIDGGSLIDFAHIDAVAALELTLCNGALFPRTQYEPVHYWTHKIPPAVYTPDVIQGFQSGAWQRWQTYGDVYRAFLAQYKYQVLEKCKGLKAAADSRIHMRSNLLVQGTFESVFETGMDIEWGGMPVKCFQMFSGSIPTVADGLAAMKQVVFEQKFCTVAELMEALAANFEGYEVLRAKLKSAPKFGNDIDEVDDIAADIARHFADWLQEFREETGFHIWPNLLGWRFVEEAYGVWATPDGRKWKDPISEHYCATPGCAQNGPTAILRSIAKADLSRAYGVAAVHVSLPRALTLSEEEYVQQIRAIDMTAMEEGLVMLNLAIYDVDALRDAQVHPERHEDLIVRVWGYCARFIDLGPAMQEHIIRRVSG